MATPSTKPPPSTTSSSSSCSWRWWPCRWSAKQYIVGGLLGLLVAVAVSAAISISLAPARISFIIPDAVEGSVPVANSNNTWFNFTLVANNTSGRTWVSYAALSAEVWYSETAWLPGEVVNATAQAELAAWHPPGNITTVVVSADGGQYNEEPAKGKPEDKAPPPTQTASNTPPSPGVVSSRVVVEATVRFRFGLLPTRPYTIRVYCYPVIFRTPTNVTTSPPAVECSG